MQRERTRRARFRARPRQIKCVGYLSVGRPRLTICTHIKNARRFINDKWKAPKAFLANDFLLLMDIHFRCASKYRRRAACYPSHSVAIVIYSLISCLSPIFCRTILALVGDFFHHFTRMHVITESLGFFFSIFRAHFTRFLLCGEFSRNRWPFQILAFQMKSKSF